MFKQVKKAIIDRDINMTKLAELAGYSRPHISKVVNGHIDSPDTKKAICLVLDKKFNELWANENLQ